ncbi:uncharacterized protein [Rutidosis leptorrhynchoides]|uniref:uncharacterized protein n=1 Tax=Rutidosis leptorrhynchoides TaxID=125765 RepID=UPI003A9A08E0
MLKKIDRVMANDIFIDQFTDAHVIFQPYRISDHCPANLKISHSNVSKPRPFKFSNYIVEHTNFLKVVQDWWKMEVFGHPMFQVVKRLRYLKTPIDSNPHSVDIREKESNILRKSNTDVLKEECFLRQKSKVEWLRVGDYLWNTIRSFLGNATPCSAIPNQELLFSKKVRHDKAVAMIANVTAQEIKAAMFNISDIRSPGPDGYSAAFFKSSWDIIGDDVICAIKDFFMTGSFL